MASSSGTYLSEWPVGLLLDEVWLRARRALVAAFEEAELWPKNKEYLVFLTTQRTRGELLRDEVLMGSLFEDDRRWLTSPSIFGASNRRFRARTPMALSFGYSLSEELQRLDYSSAPDRMIAETCGIFNFGISVFDLLHDTQPHLIPNFSSRFNQDMLLQLNSDPASPRILRQVSRGCEEPEIRLLLQIISAIYERLHNLTSNSSNDALTTIASLMDMAYAAEIQSLKFTKATAAERLEISQTKSTMPFAIINAISSLHLKSKVDKVFRNALTKDIGMLFWMIDDLIDTVGDACSGALNSLLVRAADEEQLDIGSNLVRLINSNIIETTVVAIRDALMHIRYQTHEYDDNKWPDSLDCILASYIRMWIE